jgi:hypothetical protein
LCMKGGTETPLLPGPMRPLLADSHPQLPTTSPPPPPLSAAPRAAGGTRCRGSRPSQPAAPRGTFCHGGGVGGRGETGGDALRAG